MTTTAQITGKDFKIEYSTDAAAWSDHSGYANSVSPDGGDRKVGEKYVFDSDVALLAPGKREPVELTISVVYTEGASDPVSAYRTAYENGTPCYFRFSPKGGQAGEFVYTSDAGYIVNAALPEGDAESEDIVAVEVTFRTPKFTKSVAA